MVAAANGHQTGQYVTHNFHLLRNPEVQVAQMSGQLLVDRKKRELRKLMSHQLWKECFDNLEQTSTKMTNSMKKLEGNSDKDYLLDQIVGTFLGPSMYSLVKSSFSKNYC